jgi:hypothetical protein
MVMETVRLRVVLSALIAVVFSCVAVDPAAADQQPVALSIEQVDVGFGGYYKVGKWTPVVVTVNVREPLSVQVVVETSDPDGSPTRLPSEPIELTTPGTHQLRTLCRVGRLDSGITIRVLDGNNVLATRRVRPDSPELPLPALRQSAHLWATLGGPAGFGKLADGGRSAGEAESRGGQPEEESIHVADLDGPSRLPSAFRGYDALDTLIVAGDYDFDDDRSRALQQWVRTGGHLVLAVGSEVDAYLNSRIAGWISPSDSPQTPAPVRFNRDSPQVRLRDLSSIESLAEKSARIVAGRVNAAHVLEPSAGEVFARSLDGPLLMRVPYGFGRITFLGLDLNAPPLSNWSALPELCRQMALGVPQSIGTRQPTQRGRLSHGGISDLATQLHAAQEHFPGVERTSSWTVMGLILLYVVVIGPLDYLIVHRWLQRPQLTWLTFPCIVGLTVVSAVWAGRSMNGEELRVNQLDVIDIDEETQTVRSRAWATIYSPETRRYRAAFQPLETAWSGGQGENAGSRPQITWSGIPENAFGGMYRTSGFEISRPPYHYTAQAAGIDDLPVTVWSTKSLTADWHQENVQLVESSLQNAGSGQLLGTFSHSLPVPLEDWLIAYGNRVYRPLQNSSRQDPVLPPYVPWDPNGPNVFQRELKGFLTRTTRYRVQRKDRAGDDILIEQSEYDPRNRDPADILRMMTYHSVVNGRNYTGLDNHTLRQFDLTNLLHMGRAVLFGRISLPAARIELDGETVEPTTQSVFVRIVLPVQLPTERVLPQLIEKPL